VRDSLTRFVKTEAQRLGFSLVGVTPPDPPPHWSTFENWLKMGRHADMGYLAEERSLQRRADPHLILPGCRSILVLGFPYPKPSEITYTQEEKPSGRIAAYARGLDYHLVIPELLDRLVLGMQTRLGYDFAFRRYTDTGPVLERDLAQRAGLGWIGKNTCLIHPQLGSYFFLAEILLGIDLEVDPPFEPDRCGNCTRCMQACPTGCILPGRILDASRCLSYLTIEMKASIPVELRPALGQRVFGCDVCQMVCPWNRFAPASNAPNLSTDQQGVIETSPSLLDELHLTPRDFNQKYKQTALMRTRRNRYFRNVIVALGNSDQSRKKRLALEQILKDPDPLIQEHAAWALEQMK
jgi:epoxyqueuosine reductase